MKRRLTSHALDQLFRSARTYKGWTDEPVDEKKMRELYDLMKWGPTSANSCPARFVWVRSPAGKSRLAEVVSEGNKEKVLVAPLTVIIGNDLDFPDRFPKLLPHAADKMQEHFASPAIAGESAARNGSLQGAYLIVAARALGFDCGPMSGFDNAAVDAAFFSGTRIESNFICSIGVGDPASLHPRDPRLSFEDAGRFA
ncbi:malonic semialdehyde reductase [Tardiphaga sp. 841_E9_N1_2]|jgi:3-hydroxypropanoate dehydrogenase|uniref:malonic semialdehyde reductase n=1 Tax=Tardiphaga sp. 841_E9_N1_2 TaxID=3240762 RepID=UPI003F26C9C0